MPRIRQKADEYAAKDFVAEINAQGARYGYKSQEALAGALGVSQPTVCSYLKKPDNIRMETLRTMVKTLRLDPVVVLKALGYTQREINKTFRNQKEET